MTGQPEAITRSSVAPVSVPAVTRWRRRTPDLEVMHWDGSARSATAVIDWILANDGTARYHDDPARLRIDLPRGSIDALPGDRIIKAEDGTFRPLDEPGFFSLLEPVGVLVSADVTSPAPAPAKRPEAATGPSVPVSDAAVQAALHAVAPFWREAHAVLQAYPSAALARAMLEGAAPLIRAEAEAKLAEVRAFLDRTSIEFNERNQVTREVPAGTPVMVRALDIAAIIGSGEAGRD